MSSVETIHALLGYDEDIITAAAREYALIPPAAVIIHDQGDLCYADTTGVYDIDLQALNAFANAL